MNTPIHSNSRMVIETGLLLLLLLGLIYAMYSVLQLFFGVLTFSIIFAVSFAVIFEKFVSLLGNRRMLSGIIYSLLLIGSIALPFIYFISSLGNHVKEAINWIADARVNGVPPLPKWITDLPAVGKNIAVFWQQLQANPKMATDNYGPQLRSLLQRVLTSGAGILGITLEVIAGVIVSAIFLVNGHKIMIPVYAAFARILGPNDGRALIDATARAVKGVAVGVMGTAFIAAIISWIGFIIAKVPFALELAAIIYFLVLIQIGPLLAWIPIVAWLSMQGHSGTAIFIGIYGLLVLAVDNVLKPILIARSGKLPFLVLFLGVIGGLVAWGFTGMFKGAIILSVFYTIFNSWLGKGKSVDNATTATL